MEATREELVAAHLRYGAIAEPLRNRGYAQIVAKCLYLAGRGNSLGLEEIGDSTERMLNDWRPEEEDVRSALSFLDSQGLLRKSDDGSVALQVEASHTLDDQLKERRRRLNAIYERHFPTDIPFEQFKSWFDWACIDFFMEYGKRWVAMAVRDASLLPEGGINLRGLLSSSIREHGFEARFGELVDGFRLFLNSEEPEDQNHLWSLGQAMYAARLAAAGTGADPVSGAALSNSTVLLDTNTLLDIALDERVHREAVQALGRALASIDADLRFIHETEDEYTGHIDSKADDALRSIEKFGIPVSEETGDEALLTALGRGCSTTDEFEEFFGEVRKVPSTVDGSIPIQKLDTPEVAKAGRQGFDDDSLAKEIREFSDQRRGNTKDEWRARHDAALTKVARRLRAQDEECWILSRDSAMTDLAIQWCGPTSTPLWVGLDALLQVLAVNEEGDTSDFATIFASLVASEVELAPSTYELADLSYLDERHAQVAALPDEDIKDLASFVRRQRFSGARRDDSELRLELSRRVQERVSRQLEEAGEAQERLGTVREESKLAQERAETAQQIAEEARREADEAREHLIAERSDKLAGEIQRTFRRRLGAWILGSLVVSALGIFAYYWVRPDIRNRLDLFVVLVGLAGPVLGTLGLFKKVLPWKREAMRNTRDEAERQLRDEGRIA